MKILCPVDFSDASVNAVDYASSLFGLDGKGQLELIHCINITSRASMFIKIDELLKKKAEEDMQVLIQRLEKAYPTVDYTYKILSTDPKYYLPEYAERNEFDFVVTGTTGMTQLKDITIGSLTEALFDHCDVPILAIPDRLHHHDLQSVVLALDAEQVERDDLLDPLKEILKLDDAKIHMCHVREKGEETLEYDPSIDVMLSDFDFDYTPLTLDDDDSIGEAIHDFADEKNAELMVFIHHPRTWWEKLFKRSHTKNELYNIDAPLLVLTD